jgi:hypothetical protein
MGIEAEHRVLGRDILGVSGANNLNYEQTDGLLTVFNGPNSAVAALTPFLTPSTGPAYTLAAALAQASTLILPSTGNPPSFTPASLTANPNPATRALNGYGVTTISWNAPSAFIVEVHVGSPSGPLFASGPNFGSSTTGEWVSDGLEFYLQDVSNGKALTAANTLAILAVPLGFPFF